jgi:hypothetical protein
MRFRYLDRCFAPLVVVRRRSQDGPRCLTNGDVAQLGLGRGPGDGAGERSAVGGCTRR